MTGLDDANLAKFAQYTVTAELAMAVAEEIPRAVGEAVLSTITFGLYDLYQAKQAHDRGDNLSAGLYAGGGLLGLVPPLKALSSSVKAISRIGRAAGRAASAVGRNVARRGLSAMLRAGRAARGVVYSGVRVVGQSTLKLRHALASPMKWLAGKGAGRRAALYDDIYTPKAGEDLYVGSYNRSRYANVQNGMNATHSPHHVVQNAVSQVSHGRGITINIRKELHHITRSHGRKVDLGDNIRNLAADIKDLRQILRDAGYNQQLSNQQMKELIRQNRLIGNIP